MQNNYNNSSGPNFSKFKYIPPGFAGVMIDWSLGSREITATFIDLILREYISVIDNKLIRNKRNLSIRNFEKKFISEVFNDKDFLIFDQVSEIAYKKKFHTLLKIIADGMMEEGYVDKDFQDKMTNTVKQSITEIMGANPYKDLPKDMDYSKYPKPLVIPGWVWKIFLGFILILFILSIFVPFLGFLFQPIFIMFVPTIIFIWLIKKKLDKKLGEGYDWMLTLNGKNAKKDCSDLKSYMEKFPLLEDRLANELVAFAVSFGLGKVWMNKIGRFNANMKLFIESMNYQGDTTLKFMDLQKYAWSFQTNE